jgi:hypothetical protein
MKWEILNKCVANESVARAESTVSGLGRPRFSRLRLADRAAIGILPPPGDKRGFDRTWATARDFEAFRH